MRTSTISAILFFTALQYAQILLAQDSLPAITVTAEQMKTDIDARGKAQGDSLKLLEDNPAVHMQTGGGISSLPVMNGLASDRINVSVDGTGITASCPNHMNPALSYVTSLQVASMKALPGITPVSMGGDSLGGTITVKTSVPRFVAEGERPYNARFSSIYGSNEDYLNLSAQLSYANQNNAIGYDATQETARDYKNGRGEPVKRTLYQQNNHGLVYARQLEDGVLSLRFKYANVPKQGFPNQAMDLLRNDSFRYGLNYEGLLGALKTEVSVSHQDVDHFMDLLSEYFNGTMPMYTSSKESSASLKAHLLTKESSELIAGLQVNLYKLDDWWPPVPGMTMMMGPNTFVNINDGRRDRFALFLEEEREWTKKYSTNIGARVEVVDMNAGVVQGYNTTDNSPQDESYFNSLDRKKTDVNYDFTWLNDYQISDSQSVQFGVGRKSRSPNIYERYTWGGLQSDLATNFGAQMDMMMINWFGDGNGYVGNVNLRPEVSHIASVNYQYKHEDGLAIQLSPYYSEVQDFIDADLKYASTGMGGSSVNYLQFANHDAVIYGTTFSLDVDLANSDSLGLFHFRTIASYTRGYRKDQVSSLYNQMPLNGKLIFSHEKSQWKNDLVITLVSEKKDVSSIRNENRTGGYALADISTGYQWGRGFNSTFKILNVLDTQYDLPLGGKDFLKGGASVSGRGRSFVLGVSYDL